MAVKKKHKSIESEALADAELDSAIPAAENALADTGAESLEDAIAKLTPEQAEMFMKVLTLTMKKRRIMLMGNLLALFLLLSGMVWAFVVYGNREPNSFAGWVFLTPFASAGMCLWFFGRLAKNTGTKTTKALDEGRDAQTRNPA